MKKNQRVGAFDRRQILSGASALTAAGVLSGTASADRRRSAFGKGAASRDVYVQVFLRGAMDGLTTVVPYGDGDYYAARPTLAVPAPGPPNGALDLDGFFGLAPAAAPLLTPYGNGHLAIVHAAGSPDPTRSHFDAFAKMEYGEPNLPPGTAQGGWLARYLTRKTAQATGLLRGVGQGDILPLTLGGAPSTLPIRDLANFLFPGSPLSAQERVDHLSAMFGDEAAPVGAAALDTFASIDLIATVDFAGYVPANGAQYPATTLGKQFRDAAVLVKANVGVETITIDFHSWDHHASQGPLDGIMAQMLDELSRSIEAFYLDLLADLDRVTLVCQSEFGRRVAENSSQGTDHGHGAVMLALGAGIAGGQVHGTWPGLAPAQLDQGDLAVTTDYRDVLGEIFAKRMDASPADLAAMFPSHAFTPVGVTV